MYRDEVILIWILSICKARNSQSSLPHSKFLGQRMVAAMGRLDSQIIGDGPRTRKNVQMRLIAVQGISAKMIT